MARGRRHRDDVAGLRRHQPLGFHALAQRVQLVGLPRDLRLRLDEADLRLAPPRQGDVHLASQALLPRFELGQLFLAGPLHARQVRPARPNLGERRLRFVETRRGGRRLLVDLRQLLPLMGHLRFAAGERLLPLLAAHVEGLTLPVDGSEGGRRLGKRLGQPRQARGHRSNGLGVLPGRLHRRLRLAEEGVALPFQASPLLDELLGGLGPARLLMAQLAHLPAQQRQVGAVLDQRLLEARAVLPQPLLSLRVLGESAVALSESLPLRGDLGLRLLEGRFKLRYLGRQMA